MKEIKIIPVLNGWLCFVGCQTVAFIEKRIMLDEISRYIDNPDKVEKEYIAGAKNKISEPVEIPVPQETPPAYTTEGR